MTTSDASRADDPVRQTLAEIVNRVRTDSGRAPRAPSDGDGLSRDLELDSLDLAVLVVQAEQRLGVDPFRERTSGVQTFGDLVRMYQRALAQHEPRQ